MMTDLTNTKTADNLRLYRISVTVALALLLAPCGYAENLLALPETKNFMVGYYNRQVNDRDIVEHDDMTDSVLEIDYYYIQLSYGIFEDLAVDLRLGEAEYNGYSEDTAWGLGVRAALFNWAEQGLAVGCGFRYDRYEPGSKIGDSGGIFSSEADEYNLSADLTWRSCPFFAIAGGVEYSEISLPYTHPARGRTREGGFEQADEFGLFVGAEIDAPFGLGIAGSIHFVADDSYKVGIFYKF